MCVRQACPAAVACVASVSRQQPGGPQFVWIAEVLGLLTGQRHQPGLCFPGDPRSLARSRTVVQRRYHPKPCRAGEGSVARCDGSHRSGRRPPLRMAPNGRPAGCGPAPPGWPALCAIAQLPPAGIDHPLQSPARLRAEALPWPSAQSPTNRTTRSAVTGGIRQIGAESRNRYTSSVSSRPPSPAAWVSAREEARRGVVPHSQSRHFWDNVLASLARSGDRPDTSGWRFSGVKCHECRRRQ